MMGAVPQTAREVAEFLKGAAEGVGKGFDDPEDDWIHTGFVISMDGNGAFFMLDGSVLAPDRKDQAIAELGVIILRRKPKVIGFILNTRQVVIADVPQELSRAEKIQEAVRRRQPMATDLKDEPTAIEALVVNVNTRSDSVMWQAEIKRNDKNIRVLDTWKEFPDRESRFDNLTRVVFKVMDALRDLPPDEVDRAIDAVIARGSLATYEIERQDGPKH